MNKPICILLCILLISLSVCPIFGTDYTYDSISDFCDAINPYIVLGAPSNTNYFTDTFYSSGLETCFNNIVSNYNIDSDKIIAVYQQYNGAHYICDIWVSDYIPVNGYPTNTGTTGSLGGTLYFDRPVTYNRYQGDYYNGSTSYHTNSWTNNSMSFSVYSQKERSAFKGIIPYHLTFSPDNTFTDRYILGSSSGGGGNNPGQSSYDYIVMDKPPTVYGNLWTTLHNGAWDDAAATYPSVYQNVTRGEFMFSDTSPGMNANNIFSAINVCGVLFESYMAHSYDFYDNISYNLATWMNTTQSLSEDIGKLVEVYASDQEVEAREAAADNQQAIVDNFLDSEGEGYVSPSDISSVSSMSDGYKTHMSTDAQPSGIWDIFNSNNFGWFSQETVNQLDTSTSNQRGSNTFETPYLDEKIKDIYRSLGVNYDD